MSKPDPDQFAKAVLWSMTGLQSEITGFKNQIDDLRRELGKAPSEAFGQALEQEREKTHVFLYLEACKMVGLNPDLEPPDDGGAFPHTRR